MIGSWLCWPILGEDEEVRYFHGVSFERLDCSNPDEVNSARIFGPESAIFTTVVKSQSPIDLPNLKFEPVFVAT